MPQCFVIDPTAIPITLLTQTSYVEWLTQQSMQVQTWCEACGFVGRANTFCLVANDEGKLERVLAGVEPNDYWRVAFLPNQLPPRNYFFENTENANDIKDIVAWGLACYRFERYKTDEKPCAKLHVLDVSIQQQAEQIIEAISLVRDLVNTPTDDLGPAQLANAAQTLAGDYAGQCQSIIGEDLLKQNYPAIFTVGRASQQLPRLIDLRWGDETLPKVTLIGKGICFDSGGLDIKPSSGMRFMKKDMGGAAHVLALAQLIMASQLPVRLRVLIAAAENAIAGNAYRPGDVITMRNGMTVEVDNTDAEGRLVMADALVEAASEQPDLLIDISTLTGAAKIALGNEVAAYFCNDDSSAETFQKIADQEQDPAWRLPLHQSYRNLLNSNIADISNSSKIPQGGAITAGLFLQEFIKPAKRWFHFDIMAWNTATLPGRPEGGEAMGLRALFAYIKHLYGVRS